MTPPSSSNAHEVEQCDREAAADLAETIQGWCNIGGNDVAAIRNGFWDTDQDDLGALIQAFAKHRIEQTSALREEIEKLKNELYDQPCRITLPNVVLNAALHWKDRAIAARKRVAELETRLALSTGGVDNG